MCGIAGILTQRKSKIEKNINSILNSISHRGPDGKGYYINSERNVAIGNTRLAIQDISKNGKQPFISNCGRYLIVFNGEIYNFKQLKKKINNQNLKSNSDTEILLNYYILKGEECISEFKGFFSFAIWDKKKSKLFCARDRFGIKPFYYLYNKNEFTFCSEIKPLLKFLKTNLPNENAVNSYLTSEYYENIKTTFFRSVLKLKPGHILIYEKGKLIEKPYWNFYEKLSKVKLPNNKIEKSEYIYDKIDKAVKYSLVSDVELSIAASGGLDSSILYHHIKKNNRNLSKLISFKFKDKNYSEEFFVKEVTKKFGYKVDFSNINHKYFFKNLEKSVEINEEPFAGLPIISYQKCFEDLKKFKVVLDGSGLDEAHAGYAKYHLNIKNTNNKTQDGSLIGEIISNKFKQISTNYNNQLKCDLRNRMKKLMYLDLFYIKIPRALRFRDKLSMANSIELRPPFLDDDLICALFKLNSTDHFNKGFGKWLLREKYEKILGKQIVYRRKQQIQTPQREWLRCFSYEIEKLIKNGKVWETGWIDKKKFLNLYKKFLYGDFNNSFFIWKIINLNLWLKKYF